MFESSRAHALNVSHDRELCLVCAPCYMRIKILTSRHHLHTILQTCIFVFLRSSIVILRFRFSLPFLSHISVESPTGLILLLSDLRYQRPMACFTMVRGGASIADRLDFRAQKSVLPYLHSSRRAAVPSLCAQRPSGLSTSQTITWTSALECI